MQFRTILIVVVLLLVSSLVISIKILGTIDLAEYRNLVSEQVRKSSGYELTLAGQLYLELSLKPTLSATELSIANVPWGSRSDMVKVEKLEAKVALLPLLIGNVHIESIRLIGADFLLETDAQGRGNWQLDMDKIQPSTGASSAELVLPNKLQMEQIKVVYKNARNGVKHLITLTRGSLRTTGTDSPIEVELLGAVNTSPLQISAELGSISDIFGGSPNVVHVRQLPAREILVKNLKVSIGSNDLTGTAKFVMDGTRPHLEADLDSTLMDLGTAGRMIYPTDESTNPATQSKSTNDTKRRLFSPEPLPWHMLEMVDGKVTLRIQELVIHGVTLTHTIAEIVLDNGVIIIQPLQFGLAGTTVDASASVRTHESAGVLALTITANQLSMGQLLQDATGIDVLEQSETNIDIILRAHGESVATLMASLEGHMKLLMGEGLAKVDTLDTFVGGVTQVLGTLFAEDANSAAVTCAAIDFKFAGGVAISQVMLVDTDHATVYGRGYIDFGNERIDLVITPEPKVATLNVAVPVEIGGSLGTPTVMPNKHAISRKTIGLVSAVSTISAVIFPPFAIVGLSGLGGTAVAVGGLLELGSGEQNLCLKLAATKSYPRTLQRPSSDKEQERADCCEESQKGIKGVVESAKDKIRGFFKK